MSKKVTISNEDLLQQVIKLQLDVQDLIDERFQIQAAHDKELSDYKKIATELIVSIARQSNKL